MFCERNRSLSFASAMIVLASCVPVAAAHAPSFHANCYGFDAADESVATVVAPEETSLFVSDRTTVGLEGHEVGLAWTLALGAGTHYLASNLDTYRETNALTTSFGTYEFPGLQMHAHECTAKTAPDGTAIPKAQWQVHTIAADSQEPVVTLEPTVEP